MKLAFDRPIAFQRPFVTICGSVNSALMLSQAVYWHNRCGDDWFFKTAEEWTEETGLTVEEQKGARKRLKERGFISEKLSRVPPVVHFRVEGEKILAALGLQLGEIPQINLGEMGKLISGNSPNPIRKKETTTETTQDIKNKAVALPEWIPLVPWSGFIEMRKSVRKPLVTARATQLILNKLEKFKSQGHDVGAILDESTANSWQSVYAPKSNGNGNLQQPENGKFHFVEVNGQAVKVRTSL